MKDLNYSAVIERGRDERNDFKHAFMVARIRDLQPQHWLDIGCNTGWLLEDVPGGVGADASLAMVRKARAKGLDVHHAWADNLPFADQSFDLAVLASVLHLVRDWRQAITEARRVASMVIGIAEYPGTPWGTIGGRRHVRQVIDPSEFLQMGGTTERVSQDSYFFII